MIDKVARVLEVVIGLAIALGIVSCADYFNLF